MKTLIKVWFLLMLAGVFTAGCVYVAFQQSQRDNANVPAAMAAEQAVYELKSGKTPGAALPDGTDMASTITPFVMIYDNGKNLVASSAADAKYQYPASCLDEIDKSGENRVTWQPREGLRFATVGIKYDGGYVIGAYSLRESESAMDRFSLVLFL